MNPTMILAVAAGGAIGATARYVLGAQIGHWFGTGFPWATLAVNVIGCAMMGALTELMALSWSPSPELRALLTVGVLGGFTTFSAFALDTGLLTERGQSSHAVLYVIGSVVLSLGAFFVALRLMRIVLT